MFLNVRRRSRRRDREPSVRRQVIYGSLFCILIILAGVGVWHVTRLPSVTLSSITVAGGETVKHESVRGAVDTVLQGDYVKIIPYRFFLTYPKERILGALHEIDRINTAVLMREGRNTLNVSFTEYAPYALWCEGIDSSSCYFLDQNGYAFAPSPSLQGNTLIRHVVEEDIELHEKQVFNERAFKATHEFLQVLSSELQLRVTDAYYTKEGDLTLGINGGGKIYMRNDETYGDALLNLETILRSEAFDHLEPGNFQYIDIRFGNKIFVNETKEDALGTTTPGTTTTPVLGE